VIRCPLDRRYFTRGSGRSFPATWKDTYRHRKDDVNRRSFFFTGYRCARYLIGKLTRARSHCRRRGPHARICRSGEGHDGAVNQIAGQASPRDDDDSDGGSGNVAKVYRYPTLFRFSPASTREGNGLAARCPSAVACHGARHRHQWCSIWLDLTC